MKASDTELADCIAFLVAHYYYRLGLVDTDRLLQAQRATARHTEIRYGARSG